MKPKDEITIIYKKNPNSKNEVENENNIKIFGEEFVKNNKNICKIIHKGNKLELKEFIDLNEKEKDEAIEIKLIGINNVTNMSSMFFNCPSLISIPDISEIDTSKIVDMSSLFSGCNSVKTLPDISKWDTSKVTNMKDMFSECSSLISLPDISKWNISNVIQIDGLFACCNSLKSLPDISEWDISKVQNMKELFY